MMSVFQSEFHAIADHETKQRLQKEMWEIYSARVRELVARGRPHREAEKEALNDAKKVFMSRHPEMMENQVVIWIVGF